MRVTLIFMTTLLYSSATASSPELFVEESPVVQTRVLQVGNEAELKEIRYRTPEQLVKFKEAIERQRQHVINLSRAIDHGESELVSELIYQRLWYRRGAAVSGFFGFTFDSIAPILVTVSTAAGGPTFVNYISGGMGGIGTVLLGLALYLKTNTEKITTEIASIHEREKLELARMESEYHSETKDLNIIATQEAVKNQFDVEKRSAQARAAQAEEKAAHAQAELLRRQQMPIRKKIPKKTQTTEDSPLLAEEKGKEEDN